MCGPGGAPAPRATRPSSPSRAKVGRDIPTRLMWRASRSLAFEPGKRMPSRHPTLQWRHATNGACLIARAVKPASAIRSAAGAGWRSNACGSPHASHNQAIIVMLHRQRALVALCRAACTCRHSQCARFRTNPGGVEVMCMESTLEPPPALQSPVELHPRRTPSGPRGSGCAPVPGTSHAAHSRQGMVWASWVGAREWRVKGGLAREWERRQDLESGEAYPNAKSHCSLCRRTAAAAGKHH
jgi:hypothetical protein